MSPEEFRALGRRMVDFIADYWARVGSMPVVSRVRPGEVMAGLAEHPPEKGGEGWNAVFADLERIILPGLTHWQSPNFFAYFPSNVSGPAVLGEMLSAGLGVQGMLWATSPACTELEVRVLDWLAELLGLPEEFTTRGGGGGVIQGTASDAALVALVAARAAAGARHPMVYASTQTHSSIVKAAMVAGLAEGPEDRRHVRLVGTRVDLSMDPAALEGAMREDLAAGRTPVFVCATLGTTGSLAFDAVEEIAAAIGRLGSGAGAGRGAWLHIDAAHAGAACVCPEHRWMLRGVERADSFCFNPHKWLLTNFDCNCFWTRRPKDLVRALSVTPEYLRNAASESGAVTDYRDWQVPLGRRFRALKLWFVIRHYGAEGLRAHIRGHVRVAEMFEGWVKRDERFEVPVERRLNLVCFRLRGAGSEGRTRALMERLNASAGMYLTHTVLPLRDGPAYVLRMAIGGTQTREEHVRRAWELIRDAAG